MSFHSYMTPNPYADADNYFDAEERRLMQRPVCGDCGEHIQEDYAYEIDGKVICEECMKDYRISVESLMDRGPW